jgi:hypothetical protein
LPAVTFYSMFVYVEKTVCCILICFFFFPDLYGQSNSSSLKFEATSRDLGIIKEADGSVFQPFPFVNSSSGPVKFGRVSPSCSCVNAIFTGESFESGEMGEVIIRFNPAGEKGQVFRYADIYSSEGTFLAKLSITANVIPEESTVDEPFRFKITDNVYATSDQVNVGYIPIGGSASKVISVINTSSESVKIQARPRSAPSFLTTNHPESIAPGKTATIEIAFEIPEDPDSYGIKKGFVDFLVNGVRTPFELYASCICTDRFSENGTEIPDMVVSPSLVSLKRKFLARSYSGHYTITNRGCADLHIRAVETEAGINTTLNNGDVIHPGERMKIKAESLKNAFSVFLITNDPARPVKEIRFNYENN